MSLGVLKVAEIARLSVESSGSLVNHFTTPFSAWQLSFLEGFRVSSSEKSWNLFVSRTRTELFSATSSPETDPASR